MDKIELKILGISSGHTSASYTLILEELGGERKLPVVIGAAEAQSIAVQIEGIKPVRPMTHDLMKSVMDGFHIVVREVVISKLEEGIFYADLVIDDGNGVKVIDARTSDAIALALRYDCAIYTFPNIINEAGIILTDKESEQLGNGEHEEGYNEELEEMMETIEQDGDDLETMTVEELNQMLQEAIADENYDLAARVRDELNKRK